jgi:putative endonuclease
MKNQVYILHSKKMNRYYIGFTTNLDVRLGFHENAESRKFTSKASDWIVYFTIACQSEKQGLSIEKHIKKMKSSKYIENLKKFPEMSEGLKNRYRADF